jgi:hypothetical protein
MLKLFPILERIRCKKIGSPLPPKKHLNLKDHGTTTPQVTPKMKKIHDVSPDFLGRGYRWYMLR